MFDQLSFENTIPKIFGKKEIHHLLLSIVKKTTLFQWSIERHNPLLHMQISKAHIPLVLLALVFVVHSQYITTILGGVGREYSNPFSVPLRNPSHSCVDTSRNILYFSDNAAVYAFNLTGNLFSLVIGL